MRLLDIGRTLCGDATVSAFARGCPGLEYLSLACTKITDGALFTLAAWSKRLRNVRLVDQFDMFTRINITDAGVFVLASCCPQLHLSRLPYSTSTRSVETVRALTGRSVSPKRPFSTGLFTADDEHQRSKAQGLVLAWSRTFLPRDSHVEAYREYLAWQLRRQRDSHVLAYRRLMSTAP